MIAAVNDVPLIAAGSIGILGAAIHGAGGEILVIRKLSPSRLSPSPFGGPAMTKAMIHATWHMTTVAFLVLGAALLLAGSVLDREEARAVGLVGAAGFSGFAAIALGLGAGHLRSARSLFRHPGPTVLAGAAALAWWGAL